MGDQTSKILGVSTLATHCQTTLLIVIATNLSIPDQKLTIYFFINSTNTPQLNCNLFETIHTNRYSDLHYDYSTNRYFPDLTQQWQYNSTYPMDVARGDYEKEKICNRSDAIA